MIETECFDDLNVFSNPDGSLVNNLNEYEPPLDEEQSKTSCCFRFLPPAFQPTPPGGDTGGERKLRSPKVQLGRRGTQNHSNAAAEVFTNDSTKASPPSILTSVVVADPLEGVGPPLDHAKLVCDDTGEGILDLAILRTEALESASPTPSGDPQTRTDLETP